MNTGRCERKHHKDVAQAVRFPLSVGMVWITCLINYRSDVNTRPRLRKKTSSFDVVLAYKPTASIKLINCVLRHSLRYKMNEMQRGPNGRVPELQRPRTTPLASAGDRHLPTEVGFKRRHRDRDGEPLYQRERKLWWSTQRRDRERPVQHV